MRFNRLAIVGKVITLVAIFLSTTIVLAQSATDLTVHYVEVTPANDGLSYNVNVYVSVLDAQNAPIPELKRGDFAIKEDGQKIDIQDLRVIENEPINIVLVMDTSASMSEADITDAKNAATTFINGLKPNDQIALVIFDTAAKNQENLTTDHNKVVERIGSLSRGDNGACIYDSLDSALKMFSVQTTGGRAVIILTKNSRDRTGNGSLCSNHKVDEVINNASKGNLRAPIYVYALDLKLDTKDEGEKKDIKTLTSFAAETGGHFSPVIGSSQLSNTFDALSRQLRSQYILTYNSISKPGAHNLTVEIYTPGLPRPSDQPSPPPLDSDTRDFSLSLLPPRITFTSPLDGDTIKDVLKIAVSLTTQGEVMIERVAFEVNGTKAGEDNTKPYELELDAKQYPTGNMVITATAYGANNTELARTSINTVRAEAIETPAINPTEAVSAPIVEISPSATTTGNNSIVLIAIALGGLSIVTIGALVFFLLRQQKQISILDVDNYPDEDIAMPTIRSLPIVSQMNTDRTVDSYREESDAFGALTIEASDDPSMVGHRFEITTSLVTLGRSAENDINFPKDNPVSRRHAEIFEKNGRLFLKEVGTMDSSGVYSPPKYGTFVNELPLGDTEVALNTGDEIQLGKRVRLRVEAYQKDDNYESLTYDDMDDTTSDPDKTQDSF